jgi:cysteine desulfurase
MAKLIYADHNATTPLGEQARAAMIGAMDLWGNPSSSHGIGRLARVAMEQARGQVAAACGVPTREVVFTSGGSEANAMALLGLYFGQKDRTFISTDTEHSSVRDCFGFLESRGGRVAKARVLPSGEVDLDHLESLLKLAHSPVVSLMAANNETGVLLRFSEVAEACRRYGALFHTDCVQSFGKLPPGDWNAADLVTVSAHKIYGPKGVGALFVRNEAKLVALPFGGTQEVKRRGGTQNVVGIVGFGAAAEALPSEFFPSSLRDRFESLLVSSLPGVSVNGSQALRVGNTSNVRFEGVLAEVLLSILDLAGVCVSAGSACSSGSTNPSSVLVTMGLTKDQARECVRFSWGSTTSEEDIHHVASVVIDNVRRIRSRRVSETPAKCGAISANSSTP